MEKILKILKIRNYENLKIGIFENSKICECENFKIREHSKIRKIQKILRTLKIRKFKNSIIRKLKKNSLDSENFENYGG